MSQRRYPQSDPKSLKKLIAQRLLFWIRLRGYESIELFAHECDINKGSLSRNLRALSLPTLKTVLKMAEVLEIGVDDLLFDTPLYLMERKTAYRSKKGVEWEKPL